MKGRKEEAEVIVRLDQLTGECHICVSCWPSMARKMLKLYGLCLPKSGNNVHYWTVPLKSITFRKLSAVGKPRKAPSSAFKRHTEGQSGEKLVGAGFGESEHKYYVTVGVLGKRPEKKPDGR
jgi:hypothetical protein